MPAASGWITSRRRSSLWIFRIISRRCLRFISCQWCCVGWLVVLFVFSCRLDFMLTFPCQIQLGPARLAKTTQSPQRGRAVLLCRTTPATIYTIARTGAMLSIGQERSREKAALAAEPGCASDFTGPHHNWRALGRSFRLIQPPQSGGRCSQENRRDAQSGTRSDTTPTGQKWLGDLVSFGGSGNVVPGTVHRQGHLESFKVYSGPWHEQACQTNAA